MLREREGLAEDVEMIDTCLEKILFLRRTESFFVLDFFFDSLRREKSIFSKRLWMLVKLVEKIRCTLLNFM